MDAIVAALLADDRLDDARDGYENVRFEHGYLEQAPSPTGGPTS